MIPSILVIGPNGVKRVDPVGLTVIGGSESSGIVIPGLRFKDDYAVLSLAQNQISLHLLKGHSRGNLHLSLYEHVQVEDLTLVAVPPSTADKKSTEGLEPFIQNLHKTLGTLAGPAEWSVALHGLLENLVSLFKVEKGILIAKNPRDDFQVVASLGVNPNDSWLSETLIQDVLKSKKPKVIQNIFGSNYNAQKSLMATGFVSVFAWPLLMHGESLGVLMFGSMKPHSGLEVQDQQQAEIFVQLAALFLWFHLRHRKQREELEALKREHNFDELPFTTQNTQLVETSRIAKQVAASDLSVLIHGETGTGKEVLARWVHSHSERKDKPFVAVNCGAIPSELLESLLFGHRKGAFTGAVSDQLGKFQQAHGGTLFLDEIGDLPEHLQVKLLRVLQERVVEPLGALKPLPVDVRVVAASHKKLADLVREGRFREDLYYRLAEITLAIPALRERPEDIPLLAAEFIKKFAPEKRFSMSAWNWLQQQAWRGNTRELMSAVKRASVLAVGSEIEREDFLRGRESLGTFAGATSTDKEWLGAATLEEAKERFIQDKLREALTRAGGKRALAAELLGITQRTLFRYLQESRERDN